MKANTTVHLTIKDDVTQQDVEISLTRSDAAFLRDLLLHEIGDKPEPVVITTPSSGGGFRFTQPTDYPPGKTYSNNTN